MPGKLQPDICRRFGRAVRERRRELGLSQEDLAAKAAFNRTYVGDIERGSRNVSLRNVERIVGALGLSISAFFRRYGVEA